MGNLVTLNDVSYVAGVDEAGRGPLAGPVLAAAVILDPSRPIIGLMDSKLLRPQEREELYLLIRERAIGWAIGRAEVAEIDTLNIFQATMLAMKRAIDGLKVRPSHVRIDGTHCPKGLDCSSEAIVEGDKKIAAISAASIIAKVTRDLEMNILDRRYPGYGFAEHKGYGTAKHMLALRQKGASPVHRRSFTPVRVQLATAA
jgi:ribonuclease HII